MCIRDSSTVEEVATVSGRGPYPLRPLAVSLLCGMAHSTHRTRHELWAHNVVALLLDLLKEEVTLSNSPSSSCVQLGLNTKCGLQTGFISVVVTGSYAVVTGCAIHIAQPKAYCSCVLFPLPPALLLNTFHVVQVKRPPLILVCLKYVLVHACCVK